MAKAKGVELNLFDRLTEQHPRCSASDVHAAIAEANGRLAADYADLPCFERAAFMVIYSAMVLEASSHQRHAYRAALRALVHPFYPGVANENS